MSKSREGPNGYCQHNLYLISNLENFENVEIVKVWQNLKMPQNVKNEKYWNLDNFEN